MFEAAGGVGLHAGEDVLVAVDGERAHRVTEPFADDLDGTPAAMAVARPRPRKCQPSTTREPAFHRPIHQTALMQQLSLIYGGDHVQ